MSAPQLVDPAVADRIRVNVARSNLLATLGITLLDLAPGRCVLRLPFARQSLQQHGFVHAGAVTTALDSACGYAALTTMDRDHDVLTVEFKINLMAPAEGDWFEAVGTVVRAGRTLQVCSGELRAHRDGTGRDTGGNTGANGTAPRTVALIQATMMAAGRLSD
ncbi:MAG TPA: PaaI family thioesterase [Pseudonocardia sp.]|jgi:uncharacterized protein (TIGR00369 family)